MFYDPNEGGADVQGVDGTGGKDGGDAAGPAGSATPEPGEGAEGEGGARTDALGTPAGAGFPGPFRQFGSPEAWTFEENFRFALLKQIADEPSIEARLAFIRLLDEEGVRSHGLSETEIRTEMEVAMRRLDLRLADEQARAGILRETLAYDSRQDERRDHGLRHASWRFSITAVAPAVFAILVTVFMFQFWKWNRPEAAEAFEKILVLVITGGLGWAAGRAQGGGAHYLEDRRAQPGQGAGKP